MSPDPVTPSTVIQAVPPPLPDMSMSADERYYPPTPLAWRLALGIGIVGIGLTAYGARDWIGPRGQAGCGIMCFFGLVALCSTNIRAVNWHTIGWGILLQVGLALFVIHTEVGRK